MFRFDSPTLRSTTAIRNRTRLALTAMFALGASALATAQTWVPLTPGAAPDTPATVQLDAAASSGTETWVDIRIHGYWRSIITGPDSLTYSKIEVPGLERLGQTGAPDLPAARLRVAVANNASTISLASTQLMSTVTTNGARVYPYPKEGNDDPIDPTGDPGPGDTNGTPDEFTKDAAIYALTTSWPPSNGTNPGISQTWMGQIRSAAGEVYPIRCVSAGPSLGYTIATWMRCRYVHPGASSVQTAVTKDLATFASASIINWPELAPWIQADTTTYKGRYLFVTRSEYLAALQPLIDHRKACGFATTVLSVSSAGAYPCEPLRASIENWRAAGAPGYDHYCLIVGDADKIALCPSPTTEPILGDDAYGSPNGIADLDEEVMVGRLSVDSAADLTVQVAKILNYEKNPKIGGAYNRAVLVSHEEDAPGKYQGNCEEVANAGYVVPPTFVKHYGATFGQDNGDVIASLDAGCGVVSYRGHGSTNTWSGWNTLQNFHKNDVVALDDQPFLPIAWSFSCTNQNLAFSSGTSTDSIGENWLENPFGGAVAHYGAVEVSKTTQNHSLHREMFRAVYDLGITTHSFAIAHAESQQAMEVPGNNPWRYLLLGDPAMKIRRKKPVPPVVTGPNTITASQNNQTLLFNVTNASGAPLPGVLVSVYKDVWPPVPGAAPEIVGNGYSGTSGAVVIPIGPTTLGTIDWTGREDDGNVATGFIPAVSGPWKDLGGGKYGGNGKPKLGGNGSLKPNTANSIDLYNAPAHRAAVLFVSLASNPQPFFGGTLFSLPVAVTLNAMTDLSGQVLLPIAAWPASIPSGTTLVFQYAIDDPAAAFGVGLSNGLQALTP
jgi:Peptidase family C25